MSRRCTHETGGPPFPPPRSRVSPAQEHYPTPFPQIPARLQPALSLTRLVRCPEWPRGSLVDQQRAGSRVNPLRPCPARRRKLWLRARADNTSRTSRRTLLLLLRRPRRSLIRDPHNRTPLLNRSPKNRFSSASRREATDASGRACDQGLEPIHPSGPLVLVGIGDQTYGLVAKSSSHRLWCAIRVVGAERSLDALSG